MLSVVTFLWGDRYKPAHVNALARQVARHYQRPHRFLCVTSVPGDYDDGIELVHDRVDFAGLRSPEGGTFPSCYRRLRLFAPDAGETFGERVVALDLDLVLVADVSPLWDRGEDVVLYRDPLFPQQANGSMLLLRTGSAPHVWEGFNPSRSPALARAAGFKGSDQAWLSYCLPDAPRWDAADGVYSYRKHIAATGQRPDGARIVVFHGKPKPEQVRLPWLHTE